MWVCFWSLGGNTRRFVEDFLVPELGGLCCGVVELLGGVRSSLGGVRVDGGPVVGGFVPSGRVLLCVPSYGRFVPSLGGVREFLPGPVVDFLGVVGGCDVVLLGNRTFGGDFCATGGGLPLGCRVVGCVDLAGDGVVAREIVGGLF